MRVQRCGSALKPSAALPTSLRAVMPVITLWVSNKPSSRLNKPSLLLRPPNTPACLQTLSLPHAFIPSDLPAFSDNTQGSRGMSTSLGTRLLIAGGNVTISHMERAHGGTMGPAWHMYLGVAHTRSLLLLLRSIIFTKYNRLWLRLSPCIACGFVVVTETWWWALILL